MKSKNKIIKHILTKRVLSLLLKYLLKRIQIFPTPEMKQLFYNAYIAPTLNYKKEPPELF
jgi:hypothetical protein